VVLKVVGSNPTIRPTPTSISSRLFTQPAIEKEILEINAKMTRAAEARDIDRMFSFILPGERGSIAQSGISFLTREDALETVKRNFA
jgi:hypothetical protein